MTASADKGGFLTTRKAAERLGVALSTVQGWVETGVLKAWKTPGGHRRIPVALVEAIRAGQQSVLGEVRPAGVFKAVGPEHPPRRGLYRRQGRKPAADAGNPGTEASQQPSHAPATSQAPAGRNAPQTARESADKPAAGPLSPLPAGQPHGRCAHAADGSHGEEAL